MKWLKSTTQKSYILEGKKIPQAITSNNDYLALSDGDYSELIKNAVVKSLINAGSIFVTDKEPTSATQQVSNLTSNNAKLVLENTKLQERIKELEGNDQSAEITSLKAALEKQIADDTAEIKQLAEEKDARIAELEEQLAAASKKSSKKDSE